MCSGRRLRLVAVAGAVAVMLSGCVGVPVRTFPGTDVRYSMGGASAGGGGDTGLCGHYASTLSALVKVADVIVLGTVVTEKPILEAVYGNAAPRADANGKLPSVSSYSMARSLTVKVERVLAGDGASVEAVAVPGWTYNDREGVWVVESSDASNRLAVGDRAVFPLLAEHSVKEYWPSHTTACTGTLSSAVAASSRARLRVATSRRSSRRRAPSGSASTR